MDGCEAFGSVFSDQSVLNSSCSIISIVMCQFISLENITQDGGAIYFYSQGGTVFVRESSFFSCRANAGGGMFITNPLNCDVGSCCFENCSAVYSGQAIFISVKVCSDMANYSDCNDTQSNNVVAKCTAFNCPETSDLGNYNVFRVKRGNITFSMNNVSQCNLLYSSAVSLSGFGSLSATGNTICTNHMYFVIFLSNYFAVSGGMDTSNIVNNTYEVDASCICVYYNTVDLMNCVFIGNNFTTLEFNYSMINATFTNCAFSDNLFDSPDGAFSSETLPLCNLNMYSCVADQLACTPSSLFTSQDHYSDLPPLVFVGFLPIQFSMLGSVSD